MPSKNKPLRTGTSLSDRVSKQAGLGASAAASPVERRLVANGVEHCLFEWGAAHRGRDATILLAHATGFHARIWDQIIARLGDRHVVALDMRGHGRSGGGEIRDWAVFGADVDSLARSLELEATIGVGHSMGGHAIVDAAAREPQVFERLVLVDPVISSPASYEQGGGLMPAGETHPTAKRRRHFESPEAMFERFADRRPYALFEPAVLMDYCTFGLLPEEGGDGYTLACAPEVEASIYMTSRTNGAIHDSVQAVRQPVLILRAPPAEGAIVMDFSGSPTWPKLVDAFPHARERLLADLTHFIPMQDPALVANAILTGE